MFEKFMEPFWQTPVALVEVLGLANVGTTLVGLFLFVAALELLRSSSGVLEVFARAVAVGTALFLSASLIYGDFMAAPARAVYARMASRLPDDRTPTVLAATFGAATAGVALSSVRGRKAVPPPQRRRGPSESRSRLELALVLAAVEPARIGALSKLRVLDLASRIQLRVLTNRPAKLAAKKVPRGRGQPRAGAPVFWRMSRA